MIRTYTLRAVEDRCTGDMGYCLASMPDSVNDGNEPVTVSGMVLAHDLLEHSAPHLIGSVCDEIRALGSAMYIRGEGNGFRSGLGFVSDPIETLARDVSRMMEYQTRGDATIQAPKRAPRPEAWAWEIARKAYRMMREDQYESDVDRYTLAREARAMVRETARLLQCGYNRAAKRWPAHWKVSALFETIAEEFDRVAKRYPADEYAYGGIRMRVDFAEGTARAWFDEMFPAEDY